MRALWAVLLCATGCSFLTDDAPYRCGADASCAASVDASTSAADAGGDATVAPRVCEVDKDCGDNKFCTDDGRCVACKPHRFCGDDTKSLCVDDGVQASCQSLLDATNVKACDITFPRDLSSLKNSDILPIGLVALLPTGTSKGTYGVPPTQAVEVAINGINDANGGLPNNRKLLVVQCNQDAVTPEAADARTRGNFSDLSLVIDHLVKTLRVPAIIGGSTSGITTIINRDLLKTRDTLLVSPTATDDTLSDQKRLDARGTLRQLFWRTVAPDSQQVPALKATIATVQNALRTDAGVPSVVGTHDVGNTATVALTDLFVTEEPKLDLNSIEHKPGDSTKNNSAVTNLVARQAGIIVALGTGDFVTSDATGATVSMLAQVEGMWTGSKKPWYVLSEGGRTNYKLALGMFPDLADRVIGTAPGARSDPLYEVFKSSFTAYFRDVVPGNLAESGYDATFLVAYASVLATAKLGADAWPSGTDLVDAIEKLSCKTQPVSLPATSRGNFAAAATALSQNAGGCYDFQGASGAVDYADNPLSGLVPKPKDPSADMALWCLGNPTSTTDQTVNMRYFYQQSTREITAFPGAPALDFTKPGWCKAVSTP